MTQHKEREWGKELLDKADAEIMEVVYEWARINFDVEGWAQDSTEIRDILKTLLTQAQEAERERVTTEERQFILNILDGIDIADKAMGNIGGGTKAIRFALQSRLLPPHQQSKGCEHSAFMLRDDGTRYCASCSAEMLPIHLQSK